MRHTWCRGLCANDGCEEALLGGRQLGGGRQGFGVVAGGRRSGFLIRAAAAAAAAADDAVSACGWGREVAVEAHESAMGSGASRGGK